MASTKRRFTDGVAGEDNMEAGEDSVESREDCVESGEDGVEAAEDVVEANEGLVGVIAGTGAGESPARLCSVSRSNSGSGHSRAR